MENRSKKTFFKFWFVFFVGLLIVSAAGVIHFSFAAKSGSKLTQPVSAVSASQIAAVPSISFADLVEKIKPAVVNISTTKVVKAQGRRSPFGDDFFDRFFGGDDFMRKFFGDNPREFKQRSLGSGFIITK